MRAVVLFFCIYGVSFAHTANQPITNEWKKIAIDALKTIGGTVPGASDRCTRCHAMEYQEIEDWGTNARWRLSCIKWWRENDPTKIETCLKDENGNYKASHFGLLAGVLDSQYMEDVFKEGFPNNWQEEYTKAVNSASMPPVVAGGNSIPENEWLNLKKWIEKRMVYLDVLMNGDPDYPDSCTPFIDTAKIETILKRSINSGWSAYHQTMRTKMFACSKINAPKKCFLEKQNGKDLYLETSELLVSKNWKHNHHPQAKMRIVTQELPWKSNYWFRSSPDGKFIASGVQGYEYQNGQIVFTDNSESYKSIVTDLSYLNTQNKRNQILLEPQYDPDFMPDNSAINMAGGMFCPMSYLTLGQRNYLSFEEEGCNTITEIGLYQSVGMFLNNQDSLAISGHFASDIGVHRDSISDNLPMDPTPSWLGRSFLNVFPLQFDGRNYVLRNQQKLEIPYSGDWILSKNSELAIARGSGFDPLEGEFKQLGYSLFHLKKDAIGNYKEEKIAHYCTNGAKASFSFDDRFMIYHHYMTKEDYAEFGFAKDDPEFLKLVESGISNIYYLDLLTGKSKRITNLSKGQYGLFPHVRADGWIYFVVKDSNTQKTSLVVSSHLLFL